MCANEARSELRFERRGEGTALVHSAVALPLQVFRAIHEGSKAIVTLLNPAGALMSGDRVRLSIELGPEAEVELVTTSATKLYRCPIGKAGCEGGQIERWAAARVPPESEILQVIHVKLAAGSRFRFLPHGLIPFRESRYRQRLTVETDESARAAIGEIIGPGRTGELFAFRRLPLRTEILVNGELAARDAFDCSGQEARAALGGFTHVGTLYLLGPDLTQLDADRLHETIAAAGLIGSASVLPRGGLLVRLLGGAAHELHNLMQAVAEQIASCSSR